MSSVAPQIDHKALLESAEGVQALPVSVGRLATLVSDSQAELKEIVEVIAFDQSLTATLLRKANSAALGGRNPIKTVQEAVVRLGPSALLSMALSASVSKNLNQAIPAYGLKQGELWRQSVAASLTADTIRAKASVVIPAEVSTAALLHDFGKIVLANHFGPQVLDLLSQAAANDDLDLLEAERAVFGVTHADIGGIVAQNWKLPHTIVDGIVQHHAVRAGLPSVCATVSLAHAMTPAVIASDEDWTGERAAHHDEHLEEHLPMMAGLGLDPARYPELLDTARTRYRELADRYDVA